MSALEELLTLVPPPAAPSFSPSEADWERVRVWAEFFPPDYVRMGSIYGFGCFGDFLWITYPGCPGLDLTTFALRTARDILGAYAAVGHYDEAPKFLPRVGGLLPFAYTDHGDIICWQTGSFPERWTLRIIRRGGADYLSYPGSLSDWLCAIAKGTPTNPRLLPPRLADDFSFEAHSSAKPAH